MVGHLRDFKSLAYERQKEAHDLFAFHTSPSGAPAGAVRVIGKKKHPIFFRFLAPTVVFPHHPIGNARRRYQAISWRKKTVTSTNFLLQIRIRGKILRRLSESLRIVRSTVQKIRRENWHLAKKTLTLTGRNDLAVKPKNHQQKFYCRFGFAGKF